MNLEGIINISGKPGLYKIISQKKSIVIVESLIDRKKSPLHTNAQANVLDEIGIYTTNETKSLSDIFDMIAQKENYEQTINYKSPVSELIAYFTEILPNYDQEKVYISDIKKIFQWYNIMQKHGLIELLKEEKITTIKERK